MTIPRQTLLSALDTVLPAADRGIGQITSNAKLSLTDGVLCIACTNRQNYVSTTIPMPGCADLPPTSVPVSLLRDIMHILRDEELGIGWDNRRFTVQASTSYRIPTTDASSFPDEAQPVLEVMDEIEGQVLVNGLVAALHASADAERQNMHGVCVAPDGIYSTDGRRAVKFASEIPLSCVVPDPFAKLIVKLFNLDKKLFVQLIGPKLHISNCDVTLSGNVTPAGAFPNVSKVLSTLPNDKWVTAECDADQLLRTVKRAAMVCSDTNSTITLKLDADQVLASAKSDEFGVSSCSCAATVTGSGIIHVNNQFLLDAIAACRSSHIKIELRDEHSPMLLRSESHVELIMPVRIK
jgi:DNA polymerase III sliding clamp (beta) subunit (PCNA family)